MLGRSVAAELARSEPAELWSAGLRQLLSETCDVVVCNLECCISRQGSPTRLIRHKPFFFRGPPHAVGALVAAGIRAVGVANNHALDYGPGALADTLRHLDDAGIAAAGAGPDAPTAQRGLTLEFGGVRLGLLALSDHPAEYAARPQAPGIAYAELHRGLPAWASDELGRLRDLSDLVIAFPHWGPNMSTRPARWQRERARDMLRAGADLVAGHSAHVFHGVERSPEGLVLYDLGDALDDYAVDAPLRNDLGVLALWRPGGSPELTFVGLHLGFCRTGLADGGDAEWIGGRLELACRELGSDIGQVGEQRFVLA
jgi:poly-gamma-glutamate capsule biosynthesis protein CapA/YwtB (metallophosphatase superfamily)